MSSRYFGEQAGIIGDEHSSAPCTNWDPDKTIEIQSRDFWVKIVEMLQQNWALIDESDAGVRVCFMGDTGGVFDHLDIDNQTDALAALGRNGFQRFADNPEHQKLLPMPEAQFHERPHPNGRIYSSGRYWR